MMRFERILTIFLHFLVRVPDRRNFSIFTYIHFVPMAQRINLYPLLIFYFKEDDKGFLKCFLDA
jgi:hypothetical protein